MTAMTEEGFYRVGAVKSAGVWEGISAVEMRNVKDPEARGPLLCRCCNDEVAGTGGTGAMRESPVGLPGVDWVLRPAFDSNPESILARARIRAV